MSMVCAFGPMAAPRPEPAREPDATRFREGDWWLSPAGTRYLVVDTDLRRAWLRKDGAGKLIWRWLGDIGVSVSRAWVRESWGGKP